MTRESTPPRVKRLPEVQPLRGQIEELTMMDFREAPGDKLMQARMGKVYVITHQGKAVAVLQPLPGDRLAIKIDGEGKVSYGL